MGLDSVELVLECEDAFGIKIADADAEMVTIVGQLQELCIRLIEEQTPVAKMSSGLWAEQKEAIREKVREIIAEQMGMKIEKILPESRFVQDLGID